MKVFDVYLLSHESSSEDIRKVNLNIFNSPKDKVVIITWDLMKQFFDSNFDENQFISNMYADYKLSQKPYSSNVFMETLMCALSESYHLDKYLLNTLYFYDVPVFLVNSSYVNLELSISKELPQGVICDGLSKMALKAIIGRNDVKIHHFANKETSRMAEFLLGI